MNALTSAFTQFVPSRDARVYACGVGPREDRSGVISPTAPTTWPVWGATAKPPVFTHLPGGFADVEGGGVMVRANWSRIASRNRMRRQGVEDRKDKPPVASEPPKQPRNYLVPRSGSRRHRCTPLGRPFSVAASKVMLRVCASKREVAGRQNLPSNVGRHSLLRRR